MAYFLPTDRPEMPHPGEFYLRLLDLPEHQHIAEAEARVEFLMRSHEERRAGRMVLGAVHKPDVTGRLREVFTWLLEDKFGPGERPIDFLVVLDAQWWMDADDRGREVLTYHEMCHIQPAYDRHGAPRYDRETGLPLLTLAGHDVEEFSAVVRRYGAWNEDLRQFLEAARASGES